MGQFWLPQMNPRDKAGGSMYIKPFVSLPSGRNPLGVNKSLLLSGRSVWAVFGDKATLIYHGEMVQPRGAPGAPRDWEFFWNTGALWLLLCFSFSARYDQIVGSWNH